MAFKSAYERLCNEAVLMNKPVKWSVSIGTDKSAVEVVLKRAVELGRISQESANKLLPGPADGGLIAGLLTGKVSELPANDKALKERWGEIKKAIAGGTERAEAKRALQRETELQKQTEIETRREKMVAEADKRIGRAI